MGAIKLRLKAIALLLSALLLFQSCVVYHKTPTNLFEASQEHIKTKVVTNSGLAAKYEYITYEGNQFYGMNRKSGEWLKTPLDQEDLAKVLIKDKSGSTWATIGMISIPIIALVLIGLSLENAFNFDLSPKDSTL